MAGAGSSLDQNDVGMNVGAGIMGFFGEHAGIRGDVRLFRTLTVATDEALLPDLDFGDSSFWRGAVGLTLRW